MWDRIRGQNRWDRIGELEYVGQNRRTRICGTE